VGEVEESFSYMALTMAEHHQEQTESIATPELTITSENEVPKLDILPIETFNFPKRKEKTKDKWLFAAAVGVGGNTSSPADFQKSHDMMNDMSMGLSGDGNRYATLMSNNVPSFEYIPREGFSNISHTLPFSFGLTARKVLGHNVSVESGLVYTFLSSRFEWEAWQARSYTAHQTLHYMGIPINLVVYLGESKSNWRFYLLGGFMVEKGLRAIYKQEERWQSGIRTTTVRSSIDGVQWSLNGSLGVSYKLEKNWSIHFEPRLAYSFDNKQPVSVRTEHPVYFGVNLGLNYKL
jgi:hypothetical protein